MSSDVWAPLEAHVPTSSATPGAAPPGQPWRLLVAGCLALAVLSLLLPSVPTYDPWAWLIWGREIVHGDLATTVGPSWKPLPVLFTTPFALLGDTAAPLAWLVVARAGGLLAFAMAYRLAARVAGPVAGWIAAAALVLCDAFVFNFARGNSEGILVAVSLWAIERHLDGRRRDAFLLGLAAALLRPEVWPFVGLYGVLLVSGEPTRRNRVLVLGGGLAVAVLWFVPEYVGSGSLLRAATRARMPNLDSAAFAEHPFLAVFDRSAPLLTLPIYIGAAVAVLGAIRSRDRLVLLLAAVSTVLMASVAAMTQAGFSGNLRYVALPAAIVCVLAGVGWVRLAGVASAWGGGAALAGVAVAGAVLAAPHVGDDIVELRRDADRISDEADLEGSLPDAIEAAGGASRLTTCGSIYTGAFQTQVVAWFLHVHQTEVEVDVDPDPPGTIIAPRFTRLARDPSFPPIGRTEHWVVGSYCVG